MIEFTARRFDGIHSKPTEILVRLEGAHLRIMSPDATATTVAIRDCEFEAPLGHTPRVFILEDGSRCESIDFEAYDALHQACFPQSGLGWVHRIENRWRWAFGSLVSMMVFVWAFIFYGIPIMAHFIAFQVPTALNNKLADGVLDSLDRVFLQPSSLDPEQQDHYRTLFQEMSNDFDPGYRYRLVFRQSRNQEPNAFALPDGTVVLLDELVDLADTDLEVLAVLAHELGHVEHRHALQGTISDAGVFLIISVLLGDVTSITSLGATLPTFLVENNYSRNFEADADRVSAAWLLEHHGSSDAMESMLIKLHSSVDSDLSIPEFLSTHPEIDHRVQMLKDFEAEHQP